MRTLATCALALVLAAPMVGHAASPSDTVTSIGVRYGDLNLSRPRDAAVMVHRLQSAALQACGASDFSLPEYRDAVRRSTCYTAGIDSALAALNAPAVSTLYDHTAPLAVASAY